ncbi:MAG: hypothetical protein C7B43_15110 [Sulfobacillus benefaciens]|uniref:Uncharacterized protein n=1 Tax=Sulfobacillus benefaciens TaxID=453960 RepID=A0A2T2WUY9_9FIRM|nr:MAG: hypothetical protein C7B43_15110 [Sulfobacillus benefaciens]
MILIRNVLLVLERNLAGGTTAIPVVSAAQPPDRPPRGRRTLVGCTLHLRGAHTTGEDLPPLPARYSWRFPTARDIRRLGQEAARAYGSTVMKDLGLRQIERIVPFNIPQRDLIADRKTG